MTSLSTLPSAGTWIRSARRLLEDWSAAPWLVRRCEENSFVAARGFAVLEALHRVRGRGALVVATFRRPEVDG